MEEFRAQCDWEDGRHTRADLVCDHHEPRAGGEADVDGLEPTAEEQAGIGFDEDGTPSMPCPDDARCPKCGPYWDRRRAEREKRRAEKEKGG